MSNINTLNSLIIDNYKNNQKEDYTNIAKQSEVNLKTKKFVKFKPRNSMMNIISSNQLKGEENKLKNMLFSILRNEETKAVKGRKSVIIPNKNKLFNKNLISSIKEENQVK